MGLDMMVNKVKNMDLLKKYTFKELQDYAARNGALRSVEVFRRLLDRTEGKNLTIDEIQEIMKEEGFFYMLLTDSPEAYIEDFRNSLAAAKSELEELPEPPPEFREKVPELPTERSKYWRKANAIHGWFVNHVQNGEDDCKQYLLHYDQLKELQTTIRTILEEQDDTEQLKLIDVHLPPVAGFFFGEAEINDWYFQQLIDTLQWLDTDVDWEAFKEGTIGYVYLSSW